MDEDTQVKVRDIGLLLLRLGLGGMFVFAYGQGKLLGGVKTWEGLGAAMGHLGITFWPAFWGFMAAFSEFVGGIGIALGIFFRPLCALVTFTMFVAVVMHLSGGDPVARWGHPVDVGIVTFSLIFIGPGGLNLGRFFRRRKRDY